ncbi:MAG: HAMP domain-containing protein [Anaerolineae bacterium]|nr:HAMP domain-containing protein [Anaerolineae bacterium]
MSIRLKVVVALASAFAVLFVIIYTISRIAILGSFSNLEQQEVDKNIERAVNSLRDERTSLSNWASDYGYWDDAYNYLQGKDDNFIESTFPDPAIALATLHVNFIVITDTQGNVKFSAAVNLETEETIPLPPEIIAHIGKVISSGRVGGADLTGQADGLLRISNNLVMMSSRSVLTSTRSGPAAGTLTFGVFIDDAKIRAMGDSLKVTMSLSPYDQSLLPQGVALSSSTSGISTESWVLPLDETTVLGNAVLVDYFNQPVGILTVQLPRIVYSEGLKTINVITIILFVTGVLLALVVYLVVDQVVIDRIARLSRHVNKIQTDASSGRALRVKVTSNDEISHLGRNINQMLQRIEAGQRDLNRKNRELQNAYHRAQESTRIKSEFLSTMSHELRTPLNAVIGYSGIIMEGVVGETEIDPEVMRMIGQIYNSSQHLLSLVNDILDLSKIEAGRLQIVENPYNLPELLRTLSEQMGVLAAQKQLEFNVDIAPDVPALVVGDHDRMKQVLINLLSNAFKFTEAGGVTVKATRFKAISSNGNGNGNGNGKSAHLNGNGSAELLDQLRIEVSDSGIGIPAEALEYIFDEFRQVDGTSSRSYQGTGLGLAIVRKLTELMGGKISVSSEVNKGSVFTMTLPLKEVEVIKEDDDLPTEEQPDFMTEI